MSGTGESTAAAAAAAADKEVVNELRAVLQRQASSRQDDTTLDSPEFDVSPGIKGGVQQAQEDKPLGEVLRHAGKRALGGGLPGAMAMFIQVCTLMPMRYVADKLRNNANCGLEMGRESTQQGKTTDRTHAPFHIPSAQP